MELLLICLTLLITVGKSVSHRRFRLESTSDIQDTNTLIATKNGVGEFFDCAKECSEDTCKAFTYITTDKVCKTYNASFKSFGKINFTETHRNFNLAPCPVGWHILNYVCFFVGYQKASWFSAESHCQELGGHLAKISNAQENVFVKNLLRPTYQHAWIGGNDQVTEGTFIWTRDNTTFAFTYWNPSQPNNYCGHIYYRLHNVDRSDYGCFNSHNYVRSLRSESV